jgi:hypothetical protein
VGYELKNSFIMIVLYVVLFLIFIALFFGYIGSNEVTIELEFNTLKHPFYKLGIFSERYTLEDGSIEDEFVLGLFFVNVVIVFWKDVDNSDII